MKIILISIIFFTQLIACSHHSTKEEIELKKKEFADVETRQQMTEQSYDMIESFDHLTPEKKQQFLDLQARVYTQVRETNREINQSKLVLFQSLLQEHSNTRHIDLLIEELKATHEKKIDVMIDAFFEAEKILGKELLKPTLNKDFHEFWFDEFVDRI